MAKSRGKFIVFEGVDGSGKSTMSSRLYEKLISRNSVMLTMEPTESEIGKLIRRIMKKEFQTNEQTVGALFLADRLHHIQEEENGMLKNLEEGRHVICDRYYYSSYAYHVPHLSMDYVINANLLCADLLRPDLCIYLKISVEEAMRRIAANRENTELYETEERIKTVKENYEEAFKREGFKDNVIIINAEKDEDKVFEEVLEQVMQVL